MPRKAEVLLRLWRVTRRALQHAHSRDLSALHTCLLTRRHLLGQLNLASDDHDRAVRERRCLGRIQRCAQDLSRVLQTQHGHLRGQILQCETRRKVRARFVGGSLRAPRFISRRA